MFINEFDLTKETVFLHFFMVKEILEEELIVQLQELLEGDSFGRVLFFVVVVDVEVFVEKGFISKMRREELVLFLEKVHQLIVHGLVTFTVLIELGYKEVEDLVRVVKLVILDNLFFAFIGQPMSS